MAHEMDLRSPLPDSRVGERLAELQGAALTTANLAAGETVHVTRVDVMTGGASVVTASGFSRDDGAFTSRALLFLSSVRDALGLEPGQPAEFVANPYPVATSSGAHAVYAQQLHEAVPIFQATQTVLFGPDGAVQKTTGSVASVPPGGTPARAALSATDAVTSALSRFQSSPDGIAVDPFGQPLIETPIDADAAGVSILGQFTDQADLPTVVSCSALPANVLASLIWFPLNETLVLCWQLLLTMPGGQGQYRVLVNATTSEVVFSTQLVRTIGLTAEVFGTDPSQPREQVSLPLPVTAYPAPPPSGLPAAFPYAWVDGSTSTAGTNVIAHANDADPALTGDSSGAVTFTPLDPFSMDQCVLNGFYFNSFMHDFLYLLGFREADGNFQQDDFGLGGAASDRVEVRVYPTPIWATANMSTPVDGVSPTMRLGMVNETTRHTALDASVVFHEATHGLSNRLVGGALNNQSLVQPQSAGMGEGWSDFVSCQLLDSEVVGAWVINNPQGIRGFPYDERFPATFADLGKGRYTEMHAIGEVWCSVLMSIARRVGKQRALSLMIDSLKLCPANPSMVDARDAILLALEHDLAAGSVAKAQHDSEFQGLWQVFAAAGLGQAAVSTGATLNGVVASSVVPTAAGPRWTTWAQAGPSSAVPATTSIAAVGSPNSAVELYVVGADGLLYAGTTRLATGAPWSGWSVTGPSGRVPPSAAITAVGTPGAAADLYVVGSAGQLYVTTRSAAGAAWSGWSLTGPSGTVPPSAAITAVGTPGAAADLYVVGSAGQLYVTTRSAAGAAWSGWSLTGPSGTVPPSAAITAVGTPGAAADLYVVGSAGQLYITTRSAAGAAWSGWSLTGPSGTVPPSAAITAVGTPGAATDLYVVGSAGQLYGGTRV